ARRSTTKASPALFRSSASIVTEIRIGIAGRVFLSGTTAEERVDIGGVAAPGVDAEEGIVDTRLIQEPGCAAVEGVARAGRVCLSSVVAEEGVVVSIIEPSGVETEEGITASGNVARAGVQTDKGVLESGRAQDPVTAEVIL